MKLHYCLYTYKVDWAENFYHREAFEEVKNKTAALECMAGQACCYANQKHGERSQLRQLCDARL